MATPTHPPGNRCRTAYNRYAPARIHFVLPQTATRCSIIPIGAFLLEHLLSNFRGAQGPIAYGAQVKFLNGLPRSACSVGFIFLRFFITAFMASGSGFGQSNIVYYPWAGTGCIPRSRWTGRLRFSISASTPIAAV